MNIAEYFQTKYGISVKKYEEPPPFLQFDDTRNFCALCLAKISGPCFIEGSNFLAVAFHESCAQSPAKIRHPLHPHHSLWIHYNHLGLTSCLCDGCFTFSLSLKYRCNACKFNLDLPCINSNRVEFKHRVEKLIHHHPHKLVRFHLTIHQPILKDLPCCCCIKGIQDSGYMCPEPRCGFFIHESCLVSLPEKVESSFHPQHPLFLYQIREENQRDCKACHLKIFCIGLRCQICDCWFHISCGKYAKSGLRIDKKVTFFYLDEGFKIKRDCYCDNCEEEILKGPIYRCIESGMSIHVECILPPVLDHECHHHELVLTDSVVPRDNAVIYFCDVCEEEEVFDHYVYHCKECYFMTHIECLVVTTFKKDILPLICPQQEIDEMEESEEEDNKVQTERTEETEKEVQETEKSEAESEESKEESSDEEEETDQTEVDLDFTALESCSLSELHKIMTDVTTKIDDLTFKLSCLKVIYAKKSIS